MSANVETMFSVRETPWHSLGRIALSVVIPVHINEHALGSENLSDYIKLVVACGSDQCLS